MILSETKAFENGGTWLSKKKAVVKGLCRRSRTVARNAD
jgi:hypothetical protein